MELTLSPPPDRRASSLAFAPSGARLAGAAGRSVVVWDLAAKTLVSTIELEGPPSAVALDARGERVAVDVGAIEIRDVAKGARSCALKTPGATVVDLAFHPTIARLAASLRDGTVRLYDLATCAEIGALGARVAMKDLVPVFDFTSMLERPAPQDDKLAVDWALVATDGRVDGSQAGRALVRVPTAGRSFAADLVWDRAERPRLLGELLGR